MHPDLQALPVIGPLNSEMFPNVEEGWLVAQPCHAKAITGLEAKGWRTAPSGPRHTAVWKDR